MERKIFLIVSTLVIIFQISYCVTSISLSAENETINKKIILPDQLNIKKYDYENILKTPKFINFNNLTDISYNLQKSSKFNIRNKLLFQKDLEYKSGFIYGENVHQTNDGGYILCCSSMGKYTYTFYDLLLIKTDSYGNELWNRTIPYAQGKYVIETNDGGFIFTGWSDSNDGALLVKTDENGIIEWGYVYTISEDWRETGVSVIEIDEGFILLIKSVNKILGECIYLNNLDKYGNIIWSKVYKGVPESFIKTNDNGYIITGHRFNISSSKAYLHILKTDENGNYLWAHNYSTEFEYTMGYSIDTTHDGGYITASYGFNIYDLIGKIVLLKLDNNGVVEWSKLFWDSNYNFTQPCTVYQTDDLGYLIIGDTGSYPDSGGIVLIKTDINGNLEWKKTLNEEDEAVAFFGEITKDKSIIITGMCNKDKIFLLKSDIDGEVEWTRFIDWQDTPPNKPIIVEGRKNGKVGESYQYTALSIDPDFEPIYYIWDWDDDPYPNLIGPFEHEEPCVVQHSWKDQGEFNIKVKTIDLRGLESDWSDSFLVTMPKSKLHINRPVLNFLQQHPNMFPLLR